MKKGFYGKNQGVITVFVIMIMVPVVVITGLMVDVARAKLFASQVAMASDSYGEAVLSVYDNVLKELYGLFSLTQNEEGLNAIEEYADVIGYSFQPNGDNKGLSGSMFFNSADISFSYEAIEDSKLTNENVFMTQIGDYMEFRVVQQVMNDAGFLDGGIFDMLDQFENMEADNEATSALKDIGDSSSNTLNEIGNYFKLLDEIKQYEVYIKDLKKAAEEYSGVLKEIYEDSDYDKYVNYINLTEEQKKSIDEAKARLDSGYSYESEEEKTADEELADQYVDVEAYRAEIEEKVKPTSEQAHELDSDPVDFDNVSGKIDELSVSAGKIEELIVEVEEKYELIKQKLNGCSEDVKAGIEEDIKELEQISGLKGKFQYVSDYENGNKPKNDHNKSEMNNILNKLDGIKQRILDGKQNQPWSINVDFQWLKINEDSMIKELYKTLDEMYGKNAKEKFSSADKKKNEANKKRDEAVKKLNDEEENTDARNIPDDVQKELKSSASSEAVPSFLEFFNQGFSFQAIGESATLLYDKFLLTEYDFGMFSSRVSGIPKEKREDSAETDSSEEYVDYSLNKVKMSKDINYLYGAEIEYLFGGHQNAKANLAAARNTICGVRMTMNFISTYAIKEINTTINIIATEAAAAVTAGTLGIGAAAAPLVKVAVSAALRMAVAALETVKEWEHLKNREEVLLFKSKLEDLECVDEILGLLGGELESSGSGSSSSKRIEIKMSYEDYLHVLLFLCKSESTLVSRTSDLITLNVNKSQNEGDILSAPLDFKMSETATAVKTTCKAQLNMVVVPKHYLDMFLDGNETQKRIEEYDDNYVNYTMIRGY